MDRYAPRKILQSSSDKPSSTATMHSPSTVASHRRGDGDAGKWRGGCRRRAALLDGETPAHSTVHASDIISHVTLIFESSRYVDCIRSASASLPRNIPSFLPSFSSRTTNYLPSFFILRSMGFYTLSSSSIQTTNFAAISDVFAS